MPDEKPQFDPIKYKDTTRQQWQAAADAWHRWGPTLAQWLRWFKHDWKTVIAVLKEIFPQLAEVDEAARKARRS